MLSRAHRAQRIYHRIEEAHLKECDPRRRVHSEHLKKARRRLVRDTAEVHDRTF